MLTTIHCKDENQIAVIADEVECDLTAYVEIECSTQDSLTATLAIEFIQHNEQGHRINSTGESVSLYSYELRAIANAMLNAADYLDARYLEEATNVA
jgi:hypothetical protein